MPVHSAKIFFTGLVLAISLVDCSARGNSGALPDTATAQNVSKVSDATAFMRSITPKSIMPNAVAIPPMQGLTGTRPAMSLRKPQSEINALTFTQLQGSAVYVAASPDGTFWVLSTQGLPNGDKFIYHYVNGGFVNVPGAASRIVVGPDTTPWVVNAAGGIYHLVNGVFNGIAGAASEISVGGTASAPLVDVISNQSPGPYGAGIYQYNVNAGSWIQLPGAGVTVAASIDSGTYPALNINPGGFYVTNQVGGIYYYNPGVGFEQLPGGAIRLAPTASGGIFALGDPGAFQHGIYYNDLNTGTWTQMPGAAVSISANSEDFYAIGAAGGIYQSPITAPGVFADASQPGPVMSKDQIGADTQIETTDTTNPFYTSALTSLGVGIVKWPDDYIADYYHWETNSLSSCSGSARNYSGPVPTGGAFDSYMNNVAIPAKLDVAVVVDYASNATCTGGGDAAEAAALVAHSKQQGYGIKYWTVGSEIYWTGGLTPDYNSSPNDPTLYSSRVANEYYPMMKAADPTILVGVDVQLSCCLPENDYGTTGIPWDAVVLSQAKYDYAEVHVYPEYGPDDNDQMLLTQGVDYITTAFSTLRNALSANGHGNVPIMAGEYDGDSEFPFGRQQMSIVDALWTGMMVGEVANAGVSAALANDELGVCGTGGNFSSSIYPSWLNLAASGLLSWGEGSYGCVQYGIPAGTPLPKARTLSLASQFVVPGEHVLPVHSSYPTTTIRAYSATHGSGYSFMLFNVDSVNPQTITIGVSNTSITSFTASTATYGKAQFDQAQNNVWAGPVSASLGTVGNPFSITLPPWSMTVVQLAAAAGQQSASLKR